ncbi:MAG TPA: STAS domain-containing protein [Pilimelia sp.]|nr:STAS domain-containing protein [Pilimelia sp.]
MDLADSGSVFSATADVRDDQAVVRVTGEVDLATADTMFATATRQQVARLTLDLRQVSFFDSAAINALIRIVDRFPQGLTVLPSTQVHRVLDLAGLSDQPWLRPS